MRGEITITYFTMELGDKLFHTISEIMDAPVSESHQVSMIAPLPDNDEDMQHLKMGTKTVDDIATEYAIKYITQYMSEAPEPLIGAEVFLRIAEEGVEYQIECMFDDVDTAIILHGSTIKEWEENNGARIISCEKDTVH